MKNKMKKLLSIVVAVVLVFTCCSVALTVSSSTTIEPPTYNASADQGETYEVFIASASDGGDDEANLGVSADSPLLTVNKAIQKAVDLGATANDTVHIKVVGTKAAATWGTDIAYSFKKLIIESNNTENLSTLSVAAANTSAALSGELEFQNIILNGSSSRFIANGRSVTFGENVKLNTDISLAPGNWLTIPDTQTITIKNAWTAPSGKYFNVGHFNKSGETFSKDVNIIVDNSSANPSFNFIGNYGGGTSKVKGNLNFAIYNAAGVTFREPSGIAPQDATLKGGISVTGAVQLIVNSKVTPSTASITNLTNINPTGGFYHIVDDTGIAHGVEFDPSYAAGKYKLNIDRNRFNIYYTPDGGSKTRVTTDYLQVPSEGKYTVTIEKKAKESVVFYPDPSSSSNAFNSKSFSTIAEAIKMANDALLTTGDTVTIKLGTLSTMDFGSLPKYKFDLVIESDAQTKLVVTNYNIANNVGAHTHFKNVKINRSNGNAVYLLGSSATFDKDVVFDISGDSSLVLCESNVNNITPGKQTVEINCKAPNNIYLSNFSYAGKTHSEDVSLIIDNANTATNLYFNAFSSGNVNGSTTYNGNVNINIKHASSVSFTALNDYNNYKVTFGAHVQLIANKGTTISGLDTLKTKASNRVFYITDSTYQKGALEFTDTLGKYTLNTSFAVTAKRTSTSTTKSSQSGTLNLYVNSSDNGSGDWEITTKEYFEDFNNTTIAELKNDWAFSSDNEQQVDGTTELVDGKLKIVSQTDLKEIPALNKNKNIASKEQYISMDMKGSGFRNDRAGFMIMARHSGSTINSYAFCVRNGRVEIAKYDGSSKNDYGSYVTNISGLETGGLWGNYPGKLHTFSYDASHTYRVSFSVVSGTYNGSEVAYVRGILLNLTTNEIMYDETFMDTAPYQGTGFAFISPEGYAENVCIDNIYFSPEKFRDGDEGTEPGDISGDGKFDIRDLVFSKESVSKNTQPDIALRYFDFDYSGKLSSGDLPQIRKNILTDNIGEFNIAGESDDEANEMREQILGSTSKLEGKTYIAYNNGKEVLRHEITGNIWYVSNGTVNGNGTTKDSPWTLAQLQENIIPDADYADSTYATRKVRPGDAVLFERGKEYRTSNYMHDYSTSGINSSSSCAYLDMCKNTLYGAYGTGDKPRFIDSAKNYADVTWTKVTGETNIYRIKASEFEVSASSYDANPICMIFDGGNKVGERRAFPDSAAAGGKLYTLFKDGQFTYDESNDYLYLYCTGGTPSQKYSSIEITRDTFAIKVNSHESGFVIDNLAFVGFGKGAIYGAYANHTITVTNCEFGYSGGSRSGEHTRFGNAVSFFGGGKKFKVNYNWIYHTWDSAISPQGRQGWDYSGFEVIGNLLEYNNCDIELFDSGTDYTPAKNATWNDVIFSDNIMRFTTRGWGSREANQLRGIQGVIRGAFTNAQSIDLDWTNNIIDSPGREIFRLDNAIDANNIFEFGKVYNSTGTSELGNNIYYLNPYVRNSALVTAEYLTAVGSTEDTWRTAGTKGAFYTVMEKFDKRAKGTKYYWLGKEVTSGS